MLLAVNKHVHATILVSLRGQNGPRPNLNAVSAHLIALGVIRAGRNLFTLGSCRCEAPVFCFSFNKKGRILKRIKRIKIKRIKEIKR